MTLRIPSPSDYAISPEHGFLSPHAPLSRFTSPYYQPWDDLIKNLPNMIKSNSLTNEIKHLPLLDPTNLTTELDNQRAYVVLAFSIHAYVWQPPGPPTDIVPPQLAEPFVKVCEHLGLKPVVSYAGLCLWNWQIINGGGMEVDNLEVLASFTGTRGEAAFYLVPVLVEYEGGKLPHLLLQAVRAANDKDEAGSRSVVVDALRETTLALQRMGAQLGKLYPRLDAKFFYHEHRPFMAGGKGMEAKGLPRGMVLQMSSGEEIECQLVGGSAVQSSLFPFLDSVLGVVHEDGQLFKEMRAYMPGAHRDFLDQVSRLPSLRQYVEAHSSDQQLQEAYDICLAQLRSWRGKHIALVSKYIVQPAREAEQAEQAMLVDKIEVDGVDQTDRQSELQGTGGSALMPFLRQTRDDTIGIETRQMSARPRLEL